MQLTGTKGVRDLTRMVGKVRNRESCKTSNLHDTTKCYMYKPESIQENETHDIIWDFQIQKPNPG